MVGLVQVAALAVPGFLRLGRWQVPVYGIFAAAGLIAALWLSQRTAKLVGIDEDKLWDAGMFALVAAFVASRVLLVAMDLKAFLAYPVLVLALPSLTYGGMALTAGLVWIYLRGKKLPVLDVMDAWAPCAAVLAAVLSLGHFIEGTDAGMPTRLPWGVVTPGDSVLGRVHPVELYAMVAALGICEWTLIRLKRRTGAGEVAGSALVAGGVLSFLLDMVRQPLDTFGGVWLDPSQWVALAAIVVGALIWIRRPRVRRPERTRAEVAKTLEDFADGRGGRWDWDDFWSEDFTDPLLLEIQKRCTFLDDEFPVSKKGTGFCNAEGLEVIREYARQLRGGGEQSTKELV